VGHLVVEPLHCTCFVKMDVSYMQSSYLLYLMSIYESSQSSKVCDECLVTSFIGGRKTPRRSPSGKVSWKCIHSQLRSLLSTSFIHQSHPSIFYETALLFVEAMEQRIYPIYSNFTSLCSDTSCTFAPFRVPWFLSLARKEVRYLFVCMLE